MKTKLYTFLLSSLLCTDALADYITRMQKVRHPFDKGLNARLGVEF